MKIEYGGRQAVGRSGAASELAAVAGEPKASVRVIWGRQPRAACRGEGPRAGRGEGRAEGRVGGRLTVLRQLVELEDRRCSLRLPRLG